MVAKKQNKKTAEVPQEPAQEVTGERPVTQYPKLLEFWGRECTHCRKMEPLVERLEKELGVMVEKFEVWHNEKNARMSARYDKDSCGGVPFFVNEGTGEWICGETDYDSLNAWAQGKKKGL